MHPKFEVPTEPHAKARYESAVKHAEAAKKAGKTSEEVHAVFKRVMEFDPKNAESIPNDAAHAKYRSALIHARKARANGKSSKEVHALFKKIKNGEATGCHKK